MSEEIAKAKTSRWPLWILIALCIAPIAASYIAYYWLQPSEQVNYGELLEPRPLPRAQLYTLDSAAFEWSDLRGKWVLTVVDGGQCHAWCQEKLVYLRQVRLAQGKEAERVERVWLVSDENRPDPVLLAAHEGLLVVRASKSALLAAFPAAHTPEDHIYVVDPLGNLMMRYPRNADPRRILKDMARLLRHSKCR